MRVYLYALAGIISALIGWNISQIFITDIGSSIYLFKQMRVLIIFPCIAASLAIGMVLNEILISNPTRLSLCWRKAKTPVLIALILGLVSGLIIGGIAELFFSFSNAPTIVVKIIGWLLIGLTVGLAEGLTWYRQSQEAGNTKRFRQRLRTSIIGATVASLIAAVLFELLPSELVNTNWFRKAEDPLGFSLLGLMLGLAFSFTNSPSYMAALRAGTGFEYQEETYKNLDPHTIVKIKSDPSIIRKPLLQFVSDDEEDKIEEGLSIQLPGTGKISIGSINNQQADIRIPGLPLHVGFIELNGAQAELKPNAQAYRNIAINGERLGSRHSRVLKHNSVLTFYGKNEENSYEDKIYRFVYYNRFLDPQA